MSVNWDDPNEKISKYFTVKEALWLPTWRAMHHPTEEEKANILKIAEKMDLIRELLGKPIKVHVWIRPGKANLPGLCHDGQDYNALIGGAPNSAHKLGIAVDWSCLGLDCDDVRKLLLAKLPEWKLRMEDKSGSNWVHIDCATLKPGGKRFFKP